MILVKKQKYVLLTFGIAVAILTAVYGFVGFYPFGDKQIMIIDSWHQYFPIFKELSMKLRSGESLFYTFNSGMGTNFLTMIGYYALSPLNLLSVVVPEEYLREFFWVATILKTAFGGAFFSYYLKKIFKKDGLSITIFGLGFAFSAFFINFYWDTMWLDSVAMLPLIIVGLHKLIDENRYKLYVISLMIAIVSNFYIGYFICEFIAVYYFALYFMKKSKFDVKDFFMSLGKVILASLGAVALGAIVLLPIFMGMRNAYGLSSGNPKVFNVYYTILEIITNTFIYTKPTIIDGLPNVYSSVVAIVFAIIYFMSDVKKKSKVINAIFLAFIVFSLNINYLNFVWHGFHFPNQVPYRFSFVFSFVLLTIAYEGYLHLESVSKKEMVTAMLSSVAFILLLEATKSSHFTFVVYYSTIVVIVVYFIALISYKKEYIDHQTLVRLFVLFVISESIFFSANAFLESGSSPRDDYYPKYEEYKSAMALIEENDKGFFRAEMAEKFTANDPIHYGYRGVSQFASTANANVSRITKHLGLPSDAGSNTMAYLPSTPPVNGMLAIKYIFSKDNYVPIDNIAYEVISDENGLTTLENKYYLPLGYMVNEKIDNLVFKYHKPFYNQEKFYEYATGIKGKFYETLEPHNENYSNIEITSKDEPSYHYKNIDKAKKGEGKITYIIEEPGQYYLYFLNQNDKLHVIKNGISREYKARRGIIVDLGIMSAGEEVEVEFELDAQASGYFNIDLVKFDETVFLEQIEILRKEALHISDFSDTKIVGNIDVSSSGLLYTSIPYEKGYQVFVDDKEIETKKYNDAFITFPLSPGKHRIVFEYVPYGFQYGLIISVLSLIIFIILIVFEKRRQKKATVYDYEGIEEISVKEKIEWLDEESNKDNIEISSGEKDED